MDNWMFQPSAVDDTAPASLDDAAALPAHRDSTSPDPKGSIASLPRIRRRNRLITSCLECRRRKLKCDKLAPCTNCTRFKRDCLYLAPSMDPTSQQKLADIKEKMGALEKNLEREVAGQNAKVSLGGVAVTKAEAPLVTHMEDNGDEEIEEEDEEGLEPTPLTALDNVYEEGNDDELVDLGVQMGKMRISERIGGWIRPKMVEELTDTLEDVQDEKGNGSNSLQNFLRPGNVTLAAPHASPKSFVGPGPDYIAPASSFFFPGTNMNTSLIDYLPSKVAADMLIEQYFLAVHYVARAVHRQSFEARYALFWSQIEARIEPVPSQQAIIFAALFSAAVSMTEEEVMTRFGTSKAAMVDSLRSGTEFALSKANLLRTTKLETMQAFVMYLIPQIRAEVSRAHSALVGTAIRLAECMGLHRDGLHYKMTPIEVHVRRMIWHQLCFLDQRTCDATGPRLQIRKDDYDTRLPLNVNDSELLQSPAPTEDQPYWTDMTFFRLRAECAELRRQLWFDIIQIDRKKKSLTSALVKVQKVRAAMESRFLPLMDVSKPFHVFARHVFILAIQSCFTQILHRYLFSTTQKMPDRLRQIVIEAGLKQMENAIALEAKPELAAWAWYKGAFNQYHSALLLMIEVYVYPMRKNSVKIWKCLDYIFDLPAHLSPKEKAELVITDVRDRMEVYYQMRKLRSTTQMEERVGSSSKSFFRESQTLKKSAAPSTPDLAKASSGQSSPLTALGPPPTATSDTGSNSTGGQGNVLVPGDVTMMEDIDWGEWNKYFPIEENSGDLNIPDFDFADFNGGYDIAAMNSSVSNPTTAAMIQASMQPITTQSQDGEDTSFTMNRTANGPQYFGSWMGL